MLSLFRDVTSGNTHQMSQNFNERGYNLQKDKVNTIGILKFQLSKSQVTSFFFYLEYIKSANYVYVKNKIITFGDIFFLEPLAVESLRQIKYTAKCAFVKV